jgi:hypothetical protein
MTSLYVLDFTLLYHEWKSLAKIRVSLIEKESFSRKDFAASLSAKDFAIREGL